MNRLLRISIALLLSGCTTDLSELVGEVDADVSATPADQASGDLAAETCEAPAPDLDSDGDGLPDLIEDLDRDCRVDEGETDPLLDDTDGDTLADGDEDLDRNGVWDADRGEFNPRVADTDGDGVPDGREALSAVCTSETLGGMSGWLFSVAGDRLAVPPPLLVLGEASGGGAWVLDPDGEDAALLANVPAGLGWSEARDTIAVDLAAHGIESAGGWERLDAIGYTRELEVISATPVTAAAVIAAVSGALDIFASLPADSGLGSFERFVLRLDARAEGPTARVSIAAARNRRGEGDVVDHVAHFFDRVGADAIAPEGATRTRTMCEAHSATPVAEQLDIVLVFDTRAAMISTNLAVAERATEALDARADAGQTTRVWVVAGDSHALGRAIPGLPIDSAEDLRTRVLEMSLGDADQRLWTNARAAVDSIRALRGEGSPILLVLTSSREDSEFREGEFNGYDGHPLAAPLSDGEARDALTEFYAELVVERGVSLAALSVGVDGAGGGGCAGFDDEAGTGQLDAGRSFRDIALLTGGVFVDVCGRTEAASSRVAFSGAPIVPGRIELRRAPIVATFRLSSADEGAEPEVVWERGSSIGLDPGAWLDLGVAYLYWESNDPPDSGL